MRCYRGVVDSAKTSQIFGAYSPLLLAVDLQIKKRLWWKHRKYLNLLAIKGRLKLCSRRDYPACEAGRPDPIQIKKASCRRLFLACHA